MACTHSVSMAEVGGADMARTNLDQSTHLLETKDTQAEVEPKPQPESLLEAPQEPVIEQPPVTHAPEARDDLIQIQNRPC